VSARYSDFSVFARALFSNQDLEYFAICQRRLTALSGMIVACGALNSSTVNNWQYSFLRITLYRFVFVIVIVRNENLKVQSC